MRFTKMHGLGNDYIFVNTFDEKAHDWPELARSLSPFHYGIGSDGLILIEPSETDDFKMRIFNADGSEGEMCGNGIRCVAKYVYDNRLTTKTDLSIETLAGSKHVSLLLESGRVAAVRVGMGSPVVQKEVSMKLWNNQVITGLPVSMGNPHIVVFVKDVVSFDVMTIGSQIETLPIFPNRTNVEFVEAAEPDRLKMRVWERGSGETLACGTGACASLCAAVTKGLCEPSATVRVIGGDLKIEWEQSTNKVFMTGPATKVFTGEVDLKDIDPTLR